MNNREAQDREEISALLIDYCFALDRREFSRLASDVFSDNASFGGGGTNWNGARQIAKRIEGTFADFDGTAHMLNNVHIELDGDRASSVAYITAWHWLKQTPPGRPGSAADWVMVAAYRDQHIRTQRGWRIVRRRFENIAPSNVGIGEMPKLRL
jgi:ketosteroid isomerase-like protein